MTDEAIDFGLIAEIEIFVFPTVTSMTGCATSLVALYIHSEIVDGQPTFSKFRTFFSDRIHPGPMDRLVELKGGLVVAG